MQAAAQELSPVHQALASMDLFHGLAPDGLERIAAIAGEEVHGAGEYVFREGEMGDKLYLILEGKVRISRNLAGMGEEALAILGPGAAFGEMSLIDDTPRSADALVHEPARLLVITREAFEDLLFIHKDLAYEILWNCIKTLSTRLREANDKMAFMSVTGKF
ncbi:MAG: cyclic nucleotide-binding domain-containing protein [Myxococcales bacterium]|jgi:CRP-like cAMP-binding protein